MGYSSEYYQRRKSQFPEEFGYNYHPKTKKGEWNCEYRPEDRRGDSGANLPMAMDALSNIWDGKTSLKEVEGYRGVYDVTEYSPGHKIETSHAENEGRRKYMYYTDENGEKYRRNLMSENGYESRTYYDTATDEYYTVVVDSRFGETTVKETSRFPATTAGTRLFMEEVLPQRTPESNLVFVQGGYTSDYSLWSDHGDPYLIPPHLSVDGGQQSGQPRNLWAELRNEGYIYKIGDSFILVCERVGDDEYAEFLTAKDYFGQLDAYHHDTESGLTERQATYVYLSDGTYEGKDMPTDYDMEAVRLDAMANAAQLNQGGEWYYEPPKNSVEPDMPAAVTDILANRGITENTEITDKMVKYGDKTIHTFDKMSEEIAIKQMDRVYKAFDGVENVSTADIAGSAKYNSCSAKISDETSDLSRREISTVKNVLESVAKNAYGSVVGEAPQEIIKALAATEFKGVSYAQRIENNNKILTENINNIIKQGILQGKSEAVIKQEIRDACAKAERANARVLRTEAARVEFNATKAALEEEGVEEVRFMTEPNACEECLELSNKSYSIHDVPDIPVHPNCRCYIMAVVKRKGE